MGEENNENIVAKKIIDKFITELTNDDDIPKELTASIVQLRYEKKISKGSNLKNLLIRIDDQEI